MRMPPVKLDYFALSGGLDLVTPPLSMAPGLCREAQNFEVGVNGGYRGIDGYERYDGRPSPSSATYTLLPVALTGSVAVGDTVTGVTSAATAVVIALETAALVVTKTSGTFVSGETLNVTGNPVGSLTGNPVQNGAGTPKLHGQYLNLAADAYRADIGAVPGSGAVRGVWYYAGDLYAFRNNAAGTEAVMHKATATGWVAVTTPTLNPGGRYQFANYNFGSGLMMYGCDGANKAFEFDGTTFTQITTGMGVDTPHLIAAHANHLFLAFDNSLQHSAIGNPHSWTPVLGAGELNLGDTLTNLLPQPGDAQGAAMATYTRNGTFMLYGTSSADWTLVTVQTDIGAYAYSAQFMGTTFVLDDRGVTNMATTNAYGNFANAAISTAVRPLILQNKARLVASSVCRDKNQYRLFFNNGRALYMTQVPGRNGPVPQFMPQQFAHNLTCYFQGEDTTGNEVMFAGSDAGYVYQFDRGSSFDGVAIERYLTLVFNHVKSPRVRKRYRKAALEVGGSGYAEFWFSADLDYASGETDPLPIANYAAQLSAGVWDSGVWDVGAWDGRILLPAEIELAGTAENIGFRIVQNADDQAPLTFYGALLHYTPRRLMR
jgi:hypothetical protein